MGRGPGLPRPVGLTDQQWILLLHKLSPQYLTDRCGAAPSAASSKFLMWFELNLPEGETEAQSGSLAQDVRGR